MDYSKQIIIGLAGTVVMIFGSTAMCFFEPANALASLVIVAMLYSLLIGMVLK